MKRHWTDSSPRPSDATFISSVLLNHEGRISSLETTRDADQKVQFEIKDLVSFLPGLVALLLALLGKITWLQALGVTGLGH